MAKLIFKLFFFSHQDTSLFKKTDFIADSTFVKNLVASLVAQMVKNPPAMRRIEPGFNPWVAKIPWRRGRLPTLVLWPGEFGYNWVTKHMYARMHTHTHTQTREFHGLYSPWGQKELDTTEWPSTRTHTHPVSVLIGFPRWLSDLKKKESSCQHRRHRVNAWVGKIPWRRKWQPPQYSCLGNPMDREAWWATVHEIANTWTQLSIHHRDTGTRYLL